MAQKVENPKAKNKDEIRTVLPDARFHQQNKTEWCFSSFVDFHRCQRLLCGSDCCNKFKKIYMAVCPNDWVRQWEGQIEDDCFPLDLPEKK